jgi:hypothetical protein
MDIFEFIELSIDQQEEWIYDNCENLLVVDKIDKTYCLFGNPEFYCEIVFNSMENVIEDIKSFKHGSRLDKYLSEIDINY